MPDGMNFRWLGAAGVELECGGERLLVDPYLSRVPFRYIFLGRPHPNRGLVLRHLSPARAVLITHPHFDHLMDVPTVCRELGATAYGSPNVTALLLAHGISSGKIRIIHPGDNFQEGPFSVGVFSGEHNSIAGIIPHIGRLPKQLNPPLKLSDFRMDCIYSYRVSAGGQSILLWNTASPEGAPAADVLVITASRRPEAWRNVVAKVKPKAVILIHWDDFFSPLERPIRPMLAPPRLGDGLFRRMDPRVFANALETIFPEEKIYIPDIFQSVAINTIR